MTTRPASFWQVPSAVELSDGAWHTIHPNRLDLFFDRLDALAACGLGVALAVFGVVDGFGRPDRTFAVVAVAFGLMASVPLLMLMRVRTRVSAVGIRLVGMVFVRDIRWAEVRDFDVVASNPKGDEGLVTRVVVRTRAGDQLKLPALTFRGRRSAAVANVAIDLNQFAANLS